MCGIVGGISVEPFSFLGDGARLSRAVDLLAHRGPDDRGEWVAGDRRAFLGHRRLSIIDLACGHQPIANESGRVHLCYNGEIYNFRTLRRELEACGHRFRTSVDGEAALHACEDDADGFVTRLDGMFAIAILDESAGCLTLARDRNGIKPLYYYFDGRTLIFASEMKAIVALLDARPAVSLEALRQYLRWKYIPAPLTIYENIFKLPPGHMLSARPKGSSGEGLQVHARRYWRLDYGGEQIADEREAIDALDSLLRTAVESHLESDVEVGTLLSGGVDSSLVTALAAQRSSRRIKTFSVGFAEAGFDQLPFARVLAERYGTEHHEEHVMLDPLETLETLVRHFDEPFGDSSALACYQLCRVASRHVKTVLTGDGGDESFAGYGRYEEMLPGFTTAGRANRMLSRAIFASSSLLVSPEAKYLARHRMAGLSPLERHEVHQVMCSDRLARRLLAGTAADPRGHDAFAERRLEGVAAGWSPVEIAQYIDLNVYLPDDILTKVDRTSMASSLECRVPLLDHRVTEFSARVATELKIRGGVRKYLLKKVAERHVPPELLYRPKMGFRVPIRRWFKRELLDRAAPMLLDGALVSHGLFDRDGLRWMLRQQRRPWIDFGTHLWSILFFEVWARHALGGRVVASA